MSCGLGAIILVFMLVKHQVEKGEPEAELLLEDIKRLEAEANELKASIATAVDAETVVAQQIDEMSKLIADKTEALAATIADQKSQQTAKASLEEGIKTFEVPKPPDVIESPRVGEEEYLIGLQVEGARIGILVDTSASMTDEKLIDIIRRKNTGAQEKIRGLKWQRTVGIAEWLVSRVPNSARVSIVGFNDQATLLSGPQPVLGRDAGALNKALSEVRSVVPSGPTNLQAGLNALKKFNPTDVYVITDGLPTAGDESYKSLNPFSDCSALWGGSTKISGACRLRLFVRTIASSVLGPAKINVVLLPLEGDPEAADAYWRWTSSTGGILISPAAEWP